MRFYRLPNQKAYPSVTTIVSFSKEGKTNWGLRNWKANNPNWDKLLAYYSLRGTLAHNYAASKCENMGARSNAELELFEADHMLKVCKKAGKTFDDLMQDVATSAQFFEDFLKDYKFEPLMSEQVVWSDKYRYAGQTDLIGWLNGELAIIDIKTSKAVYRDSGYDMQLSAYAQAIAERTGNPKYLQAKRIILLLSPDIHKTNRFTYKMVNMPDAWSKFEYWINRFHKVGADRRKAGAKVQYRDFTNLSEKINQ